MYSKCGDTQKALEIFHGLTQSDIFSWTTMIFRLTMKGESDKVLHVPCERIFMDRSRARVFKVDHQP